MSPEPHIVLIGLRGCGKSTLGKQLADALGRPFLDLDVFVSERMGMGGPGAIIEEHGIERFRAEETAALAAAIEHPASVLALGGGTPTAPGAMDLLVGDGVRVIYLRATPETLTERLRHTDNTDRPALVGDDPVSEVRELFDQRDGIYQNLAESIVHVDGIHERSALAALVALARAGV
ncbi:MAG: shikimate kinase [Phycisphaerales bacterium]|nr:shikimate kinase [Phycisphaerales bacterium]